MKKVTFHKMANVMMIPSLSDYTPFHKQMLWYSSFDFENFKNIFLQEMIAVKWKNIRLNTALFIVRKFKDAKCMGRLHRIFSKRSYKKTFERFRHLPTGWHIVFRNVLLCVAYLLLPYGTYFGGHHYTDRHFAKRKDNFVVAIYIWNELKYLVGYYYLLL